MTDTARTTSPCKACEKSREETTSGVTDTARTTSPRKACEKSRKETTPGVTDTARTTSPRKVCEKSCEETTLGVTDTARTTSPRKACEKSREETMPGVTDTARTTSPGKACEKNREETMPGVTDTMRTTSPRQMCEYTGSVSTPEVSVGALAPQTQAYIACQARTEKSRQDLDTITLGQAKYIQTIVKRFGMEVANPAPTPLHDKTTLVTEPQGEAEVDAGHYQSIISSLSYTATATRPDIAFAVSLVSHYSSRPFTSHLTAAKQVLRYLKGTANHKLVFRRIPVTPSPILRFADSDFAGNINQRKSQGGYVFQVYNGPVSWKSYKQSMVALSTTEAEYVACSEAV